MYLYATMVGFSRIYLKKHYPTDVIADFYWLFGDKTS
jgi:membrane-associated phospholipid phosphatase